MQTNNRRQFIKTAIATSTIAAVRSSTSTARADSANDTIRVAVVGLGGRGRHSLCVALRELAKENVEIVAMSDVDEKRMNDAADEHEKLAGKRPKTAVDMRNFLDDKNIDVVVLATPNHLHALQTIWCCQAGKDVFVEKPASHNVTEGRRMIEAARKYGRMVQVGTQCRTSEKIRDGIAKLNEGVIGRVYSATSDVLTSTVDHFISLAELLDIPFPEEQVTDGESYVGALKGETYERGPISTIFPFNYTKDGNRPSMFMRQGPWKLFKFFYDGEGQTHRYELYNLEEDIGETTNLAGEMPERVREMTALLEAHVTEAEYLLPQKNRNYGGNVAAGWLGSGETKVSVKDKILSVQSGGKEPWVETRYTPNVRDAAFALEFEMKSTSRGTGAVSWSSGSTAFDPIHDGNWYSYRVEIPLAGILGNLGMHPSSGPGNIQLRNIRLETADGHYVRDWPLC